MIAVNPEHKYLLNSRPWHIDQYGYVYTYHKNRQIKLHKVLLWCPKDYVIDHINGDRLDNRLENLRICTQAQNMYNTKLNKRNKTGYKGVAVYKNGKYTAQIKFEGKKYHLGIFACKVQAHEVYKKKAKELFGEFARFK